MFRVDRKISVKVAVILIVLTLLGVMYAQSAKPVPAANPAPAPVPLLARYPRVSPEFLAQYPDEPVEKVVQANASELYRANILQQAARIDALEKRVAELEKLVAPKVVDPNTVKAPTVETKAQ